MVNLIRCFAYPILVGCVTGLVVMLRNKMCLTLIGAAATLIVCLVLGYLVELFVLLAFHVLGEGQIKNAPGGFIIIWLGRTIGVI